MNPARWKKPLLSLAILIASCILAEVSHRAWLLAHGEGYSWWRTRERIDALRDVARNYVGASADEAQAWKFKRFTGKDSLHPFIGFERKEGPAQIESDLALMTERPDDFRVMVLGGSVAAIFCALGTERLFELLGDEPRFADRKIRVLRYSRAGFKQPQQLMLLAYVLSLGIVPDAVVSIDGFNEVAVGGFNYTLGIQPTYPGYNKWMTLSTNGLDDAESVELLQRVGAIRRELLERTDAAVDSKWLASSIIGTWTLARLESLRTSMSLGQEAYLERLMASDPPELLLGPRFRGSEAEALEFLVQHWKESSRSIRALCESRRIRYLHVLQPALHDRGSKPLLPEEIAVAGVLPIWERCIRAGYPMLRQAGLELRADGEDFLDASAVFADVEEKIYRDACHFGARGNELLAEFIAPPLLDLLEKSAPR